MRDLLASILDELKRQRQLDLSGYRPRVLERRLAELLERLGGLAPRDYLARLQSDPAECDRLVGELLINVSCFFRNPIVFEILAQRVLPELIERHAHRPQRELRLWSAGCGTGEEPYSLAILVRLALRGLAEPWTVHLFASDIDRAALEQARAARWGRERLENVKLGVFDECFRPADAGEYTLAGPVREMVRFCLDDLADGGRLAPSESVFGTFDLILCRNVLIYFSPPLQQAVLRKLHRSLAPGGYLVLGEAEDLGHEPEFHMRVLDARNRIYQKIADAARPRTES